jgi:hypothetical protein
LIIALLGFQLTKSILCSHYGKSNGNGEVPYSVKVMSLYEEAHAQSRLKTSAKCKENSTE